MLRLPTKIISIFLIFINFLEYTTGNGLQDSSKLSSKNSSYKLVQKSYGIYQIAWNPFQFKKELNKNLSILKKQPSVIMFFRDMSHNRGFPLSYIKIIDSFGAIPMISWELWIWGENPKKDYLKAILEKQFDSYFIQWCRDLKKWEKPIFIRPGFEMNGNWFAWCGNPEKFKSAWQHIYNLFKREDCGNALWVWAPNTTSFPDKEWNQMERYYPGDEFVDWVGLDGYNWGDEDPQRPYSKWVTFNAIFDKPLNRLTKLAQDKPIMISEIGCAETISHNKAKWIEDAFQNINKFPGLKLLIWFNYDKRGEGEPDWRIDSSPEALETFNKCVSRFQY